MQDKQIPVGSEEETDKGIAGETEDKSVTPEIPAVKEDSEVAFLQAELEEMKDKYVRLYAEFENYKKKAIRDKEDFIKYANETIILELLPALDNLEMALKHVSDGGSETADSLAQGVENTFRELKRILEKSGLKPIEAKGKAFDPVYHHAMSQVEKADMDQGMVVEEFRKGYLYKDKVLRPSFVAVSKKPASHSKHK
jgi:molecular chaperone GrpE